MFILKTVLLLTNQLHLALKISSAGNKNNVFINNVSQFDKITSLLDSYDFSAFIIDLSIWNSVDLAIKDIYLLKKKITMYHLLFLKMN